MGTRTRQPARMTLTPRKRKSKILLVHFFKRWLVLLVVVREECLVECHPALAGCLVECLLVDSVVLVDFPVLLLLLVREVTQLMRMMVLTSRKSINKGFAVHTVFEYLYSPSSFKVRL